jgi:selenide, water dikinase
MKDPNVMRGLDSMDNAGVYKLREDLAIIQTVDFFTPIVDDPYSFGQIAVANSLSDIYTMGGKPLTAMNIVCFPSDKLDISVLRDTLRGGADKMKEAGVILVGGHSVKDNEFKYGLSVTGTIHPRKLITNAGVKPGDSLILTKPLGTGIISTAMKSGKASKSTITAITKLMATLNGKASELMLKHGAEACTDVTGFGFIGHLQQMAKNSGLAVKVDTASVPHFKEALKFAAMGLNPGGLDRNRNFYKGSVKIKGNLPENLEDLLYDPQTSGGLLIAIKSTKAGSLLVELIKAGYKESAIVAEAVPGTAGQIILQ